MRLQERRRTSVAAAEELGAVAPLGVLGVGERHALGLARIPRIFGSARLARGGLGGERRADAARAAEFVKAGNYFWNSGMFLWSARTLTNALLEHLPKTACCCSRLRPRSVRAVCGTFARLYPKCENISIDYAVLEPRSGKGEQNSNIICLPADFGWNDLGSWTALHEHHVGKGRPMRQPDRRQRIVHPQAQGNYIHAPGKFVAALGVNNLVVVETEDALLITTRDQAQDVGKVVKYLDEKKLSNLV